MGELLQLVAEFFLGLLEADDRPEAQKLVLGCLGVLLLLTGIGLLIWWLW